MRSRLVEPGVPNGTPAAMTIVCPGCANCSSSAVATARCVMSLTPLTSLHTTGLTPQGQCEPTRRLAEVVTERGIVYLMGRVTEREANRERAPPGASPNEDEQPGHVPADLPESIPHPLATPTAECVERDAGGPGANGTGQDDSHEPEMPFVRGESADDRGGLLSDDPGCAQGHVRPGFGEMAEKGMGFHGLGIYVTGVGNRESGIGNRESGIGNRESGIGNRSW